jgi:hypothetical protein
MGGACSSESEHPGVGGRIILRWIFRKQDVRVWTGVGWLRIETGYKNQSVFLCKWHKSLFVLRQTQNT